VSGLIDLKPGAKLVVIGSSFISMELADAASGKKLSSVDVIGQEEYPFEMVLGKEFGKVLKGVGDMTQAEVFGTDHILFDSTTNPRR
jgi:hypothetical protein